jgi:dUTPase
VINNDIIIDIKNERKFEMQDNIIYWAKVNPNAKIPKRAGFGEAGIDIWSCIISDNFKVEEDGETHYELLLKKDKPTLVPTGVASRLSPYYYLNLKHERGSTGKLGKSVLSGVVDSTYNGEIFVNITPLYKDVLLTTNADTVEEYDDIIIFPVKNAICQATIDDVNYLDEVEISYEELLAMPSTRGANALGSTDSK